MDKKPVKKMERCPDCGTALGKIGRSKFMCWKCLKQFYKGKELIVTYDGVEILTGEG